MKPYIFVLVGLLFAGCCCVSSDIAESGLSAGLSCKTYSQSCQKSCSTIAPFDSLSCVQECENILREEGIDPAACCPEQQTVGAICEIDCNAEYNTIDQAVCMEQCEQVMSDAGLDMDDCIVPA